MLLVDLLDALGFLVKLNFGSSHLALLGQQLVLQLQQFVLTLLHCCQQLVLILRRNGNIRLKNGCNGRKVYFTSATVCTKVHQYSERRGTINISSITDTIADDHLPLLCHNSLLLLDGFLHSAELLLLLLQLVLFILQLCLQVSTLTLKLQP